jgi:hypothetical protein
VSEEQAGTPGEQQASPAGASGEPSEEELRAAYEAELSRLTSADLIAQAVVSLLNLGARRLGPIGPDAGEQGRAEQAAGERDLGQVRDAIDAVRALLEILERSVPDGVRPLRDALSQLQMAYAREVQAGAAGGAPGAPGQGEGPPPPPEAGGGEGGAGGAPAGGTGAQDEAPASGERPDEPGPAQRSGRLWVPGS